MNELKKLVSERSSHCLLKFFEIFSARLRPRPFIFSASFWGAVSITCKLSNPKLSTISLAVFSAMPGMEPAAKNENISSTVSGRKSSCDSASNCRPCLGCITSETWAESVIATQAPGSVPVTVYSSSSSPTIFRTQ